MRRHKKNYVSFFLEIILLLSISFILTSSYILWFVLPRGLGMHGDPHCDRQGFGISGTYWEALGWDRVTWIEVHNWASVTLLVLIFLHIIFHWGWIIATTKKVKDYIGKRLKRVSELYIASVILLALFAFNSFSGFIVWLFLPRGAGDYENMLSGVGRTFCGLQRNVWLDLHAWSSVIIIAMVIIHLILNWNWVLSNLKNIKRNISRSLYRPS